MSPIYVALSLILMGTYIVAWDQIDLGSRVLDTNKIPTFSASQNKLRTIADKTTKQFIFQLHSPMTEATRKELTELLGQSLQMYISDGAYIFFGTEETAMSAESSPLIRWVGVRPRSSKLNSVLLQAAAMRTSSAKLGIVPRTDESGRLCLWIALVHSNAWANRPSAASVIDSIRKFATTKAKLDISKISTTSSVWNDVASTITEISHNKISIWIKREHSSLVSAWLAMLTEVDSVEIAPKMSFKNKYARNLLLGQSVSATWDGNQFYAAGLNGTGQIVGVADSGVDIDNCMFWDPSGTIAASNAVDFTKRKIVAYVRYASGCSSSSNCGDYLDDAEGHGTHVSGSVVGYPKALLSSEEDAARPYSGMAPGAKLYFTDIANTATGNLSPPDDLSTGLFPDPYAAGVRIHSDSWGCSSETAGGCNYYDTSAREVDDYMWQHQDFLVLIAAGNSGTSGFYTVETPATCKNCFAVGASQTSLEGFKSSAAYMDANAEMCGDTSPPSCCTSKVCTVNDCCPNYMCCSSGYTSQYYGSDNMAEFSSKGYTMSKLANSNTPVKTYGRVKPDIVSVGASIVSANSDGNPATNGAGKPQCGLPAASGSVFSDKAALIPMSGTSMATPVLAGTVALVRQYFVDGWYPSGAPTISNKILPSAALLKATVLNSAKPFVGQVYDPDTSMMVNLPKSGPNQYYGYGRPDLSRILKIASSGVTSMKLYVDDVTTSGLSTSGSKEYSFSGVTSSSTTPFTVTLVWTDPPGSLTAANQLVNNLDLTVITGDTTLTTYLGNGGTTADTVNNIEVVVLSSLSTATPVKIRVAATNIAVGKQTFAIVVSGSWTLAPGEQATPTAVSTVTFLQTQFAAASTATGTFSLSTPVPNGGALTLTMGTLLGPGSTGSSIQPTSLALVAGASSGQFSLSFGGSAVGPVTVTYTLSGSSATMYTTPTSSVVSALGSIGITGVVSGVNGSGRLFYTQTSRSLSVTASGTVQSGKLIIVNIVATGVGATGIGFTPASQLVISAGQTTATFSVTAGSTSGDISLTLSVSGTSASDYTVSTTPVVITVNPPAAISVAGWSSAIFTNQVLSGAVLTLAQAPPTGLSLTVTFAVSGPASSSVAVPSPLLFSGTMTQSPFSLTAGSVIGALSLSMALSGTAAFAFALPTSLPLITTVSSQSSAVASAALQSVASTSIPITLTLGSAVPSGGVLTITATVSGSASTGATFNPSSAILAGGSTSGSMSCTPTQSGSLTISFSISGTSAPGYAPMASLTISILAQPVSCSAGQYGPSGQTPCKPCDKGTYQSQTAQSACLACPQGQSTASTGAQSSSACAAVCPVGQFSTNGGVAPCSNCAKATYADQAGMLSCLACASGLSTVADGATSSSQCLTMCSAGSFSATGGVAPCSGCALGTYQSNAGQTACAQCPSGSSTSGTSSVSSSSCKTLCLAGTYGSSGLAPCTLCAIGSYSSVVGSTGCSSCSVGSSTNAAASTSAASCLPICPAGTFGPVQPCTSCPVGTYSSSSASSSCTPCANGTTTATSGSTSASSCNSCLAGFYGSKGSTPCFACPKGSVTAASSLSSCTQCDAGSSTVAEASTQCATICNAGYYGSGGVSPCLPCPLGSFAEGNTTSVCQQCGKGQVTLYAGTTTRSACVTTLELIFPPSASGYIWPSSTSRYVTWKTAALDQADFLARQVLVELVSSSNVVIFSAQSANDGSELIEMSKVSGAALADGYFVRITLLPADQTPVAIIQSSPFSIMTLTASTPDPVGVNLALAHDLAIPAAGTAAYMALRDSVLDKIAQAMNIPKFVLEMVSLASFRRSTRHQEAHYSLRSVAYQARVNIYPNLATPAADTPLQIANNIVKQSADSTSNLRQALPTLSSASVVGYSAGTTTASPSNSTTSNLGKWDPPPLLIGLVAGGAVILIGIVIGAVILHVKKQNRSRMKRGGPKENRAQEMVPMAPVPRVSTSPPPPHNPSFSPSAPPLGKGDLPEYTEQHPSAPVQNFSSPQAAPGPYPQQFPPGYPPQYDQSQNYLLPLQPQYSPLYHNQPSAPPQSFEMPQQQQYPSPPQPYPGYVVGIPQNTPPYQGGESSPVAENSQSQSLLADASAAMEHVVC